LIRTTATTIALILLSAGAASGSRAAPVGVVVQADAHPPQPWRTLTTSEQAKFDLGYATFNTEWSPASSPARRTDGLGPLFNVQSCDACHNSRRRGRAPRGSGEAPAVLVIQLGRELPDGRVERGTPEYGRILNTSATAGFTPEATVTVTYQERQRWLVDNSTVSLRMPSYSVSNLSGPALPDRTVLMPRLPPPVMGAGLLERVPESALATIAASQIRQGISGRISRLSGTKRVGRYGWQATEPTVASQTASAFAREMGLTSPLESHIDCGESNDACLTAPSGGTPEVDAALFDAVVWFQELHAVPVAKAIDGRSVGAKLFASTGCAECHRPTLPVELAKRSSATIAAYTDLLVHDLGDDLADRDLLGQPVHSEWRTAPLWGMGAAVATGQPLGLLHDGRARSVREAILWHGGVATPSLSRYLALEATERTALEEWIERL
jgi:CxxC motif-containing protein (DUF1111 family)